MKSAINMSDFGLLHWPYENPQNFEALWFEKVDGNELRYWAKRQLPTCGVICVVYLLFIWLGPKWMKNRKPYKLDKPLVIWNFFLSIFSLIVCVRMWPEIFRLLSLPDGYYRSVCVMEGLNYPSTFWGFLFVISKVVELGDTVFIVLRKKPLIFLHWFHHFNMVWSTFFIFVEGEPGCRWPTACNSFVHTLMYAYYGARALQIKLPRKVPMVITSLQISQFIYAIFGQYHQLVYYAGQGKPCIRTTNSIVLSFTFAFCYLYLFAKLFYSSYIAKEEKLKTA